MEVSAGSQSSSGSQRRVGILYDDRMCKHHTPDGDPHPENPNRIREIWKRLQTAGVHQRCVVLDAKEVENKHVLFVHSKKHVDLIRNISSKQFDSRRNRFASKFNSIYFNEGSSEAAYLAAGSVIEVSERVAKGELSSAFAIVRPPGHHAEHDEAMGFCLFNNVAVAASFLLNQELGIKKILIVDWDVHHGNGTQKMFWKDSRVLFFSVHRHEFGSFYPANDDGFYDMIGEGPGVGYNINVPWEHGRCGDADYLAVWNHILLPVAKEFNPDMIIISAGFDAAVGDPLGGCRVTPYGYSVMLKKLMNFAQGKIVLALEGGYNLNSIADSALACVEVLLDTPSSGSSEDYPFESTWRVIKAVRQELSPYWPALAHELPAKLISQSVALAPNLMSSSDSEADEDNGVVSESTEEILQGVIQPLSKLKVDEDSEDKVATVSNTWRLELSKIDVWYASFGSNMWKSRFLCYVEGGQVEGMQKPCPGSADKTPPKDIVWKTYPYRLFFGRDFTLTWGSGGVAFLHPESKIEDKAYFCLYRITLEQFNDILRQENGSINNMASPLFDLTAVDSVTSKEPNSLEVLKGWYGNVIYLGKEQDIPILTMTCSHSDARRFKAGELPSLPPCEEYKTTLMKGLVDGRQLSEEEAIAYLQEASTKPL